MLNNWKKRPLIQTVFVSSFWGHHSSASATGEGHEIALELPPIQCALPDGIPKVDQEHREFAPYLMRRQHRPVECRQILPLDVSGKGERRLGVGGQDMVYRRPHRDVAAIGPIALRQFERHGRLLLSEFREIATRLSRSGPKEFCGTGGTRHRRSRPAVRVRMRSAGHAKLSQRHSRLRRSDLSVRAVSRGATTTSSRRSFAIFRR